MQPASSDSATLKESKWLPIDYLYKRRILLLNKYDLFLPKFFSTKNVTSRYSLNLSCSFFAWILLRTTERQPQNQKLLFDFLALRWDICRWFWYFWTRSDLGKHSTIKNCDKTFLKKIWRIKIFYKTTTFLHWLNLIVKSKNVSKLQFKNTERKIRLEQKLGQDLRPQKLSCQLWICSALFTLLHVICAMQIMSGYTARHLHQRIAEHKKSGNRSTFLIARLYALGYPPPPRPRWDNVTEGLHEKCVTEWKLTLLYYKSSFPLLNFYILPFWVNIVNIYWKLISLVQFCFDTCFDKNKREFS